MDRMTSPNYRDAQEPLALTAAIIQPQCMIFRDDIVQRISDAGFTTLQSKIVQLTGDQVSELFTNQQHTENFEVVRAVWTAGPIMAMCLSKPKAVEQLKALLGTGTVTDICPMWPGCLRSQYATDAILIGVHGSDGSVQARHEIGFFFPDIIVKPLTHESQETYLKTQIYPTLMDALYEVAKNRPHDPIAALATALLAINPNRPQMDPPTDCTLLLSEIDEMQLLLGLTAEPVDECDEPETYRKHGHLPVIIEEEPDDMYRSV